MMMEKVIKKIMAKLLNNGFEAYVIGGYVRDTLLGISTNDIDICTNALPKDIYNLFNKSGNAYGGTNLKVGKYNIDITTYRRELAYEGHNITKLEYIDSFLEDLQRRDFTINAIAMDIDGNIIDKLEGVNDLNNLLIRCIGNPSIRLKEDPLRILRAIRLATVLDFEIEDNLLKEIKKNKDLVLKLSGNRIKGEINKILMSHNFLKGLNILKEVGLDKTLNFSYQDVVYTSDLLGMYAQVKFYNMPFTNNEKSNIIKIAKVINYGKIDNFILYKYGLYISLIAGNILNYNPNLIHKMYKRLPIKDKKDLKVSNEDIIKILDIDYDKRLGQVIEDLEYKILNNEVKNDFKKIKEYLLGSKGKWDYE